MISLRPLLRRISPALALALVFGVLAAGARAEGTTLKVTFALVSDIYELEELNGRGGFARIAAAIKAERQRNTHVIVAHAGDTISPSLFSGFDEGAHIMDLTNRLAPDIFVPGNHEFDFGEDVFRTRMAEASFPVLAANLTDALGKPLTGIGATRMIEIEGVKIGIAGLTADDSHEKSRPGSLKIAPVVESTRRMAGELRAAGADLVVAVVHASRREDLRLYLAHDADILLSGDDHDLAILYDGKSAFAETISDGEALVAVDVEIKTSISEGQRSVAWRPRFRVVDTADVTPDAEIAARVADYMDRMAKELDVPVGKTETALDSSKALVRSEETALGNLVADALREAAKAEVAIVNGGGLRGNRTYPAGHTLTRRDVLTELPFANKLVKVKLSGADLKAALENGLTFAGKPAGRFPHVAGMRAVVRKDAVAGSKIESLSVGGVPLDPARLYEVATNDFIAGGKEGYGVMASAERLLSETQGPLVSRAVMDYIAAHAPIAPKVDGRLRIE